jgi:hypothetical protein
MSKSTKINIGNSYGYILNDYQEKYQIINYLYDKLDYDIFSYKFIESESDLIELKNNSYYVMPHFASNKYLLVFINIKENDWCVLINKNYFKSKIEDVNLNNIKIISIKMRTILDTYNGTIFDGTLININNDNVFVINDAYFLGGKDVLDIPLDEKHDMIDKYIDSNFINDNKMNNIIKPVLNQLYTYDDLHKLVYEKIKTTKLPINGITFVPNLSNTNYIFIDNINEKKNKIEANFLVKKTDIVDVYELYADTQKDLVRYGIADIPNIKYSTFCQEIFKKNESYIMKCEFSYKTQRWIPIEIINDKIPEMYKEIKKKIKDVMC